MSEPTDEELRAAVDLLTECVAKHLPEPYEVELIASMHDSAIRVRYIGTEDVDDAETIYYGQDWGAAVDFALKHAMGSTQT